MRQASKISLIVSVVLCVLGALLLPRLMGGSSACVMWYSIMVLVATVPLVLGPGGYRIAGGIAVLFTCLAIHDEIVTAQIPPL